MITIIEADGNKYAWLDVSRDKKGYLSAPQLVLTLMHLFHYQKYYDQIYSTSEQHVQTIVIRFMHRPRSTCFFALFLPILEFYVKSCAMEWTILLVYVPFPDKTDVNNSFVNSGVRKLPWSSWFSPGDHDTNTSGALRSSCLIILTILFIVSLVS